MQDDICDVEVGTHPGPYWKDKNSSLIVCNRHRTQYDMSEFGPKDWEPFDPDAEEEEPIVVEEPPPIVRGTIAVANKDGFVHVGDEIAVVIFIEKHSGRKFNAGESVIVTVNDAQT